LNKNLKIINVGGTFNKIYLPTTGELVVPQHNHTIFDILKKTLLSNELPKIEGIIYKDSLKMDKNDRKILLDAVIASSEQRIIIVHGTDTMKKSAKVLGKFIKNKTIIFVGAMKPYSYEKTEASFSLGMALGFLKNNPKKGVFICMNGLIKKHTKIKKDYEKGVFVCL
jgi:L-asparaginase